MVSKVSKQYCPYLYCSSSLCFNHVFKSGRLLTGLAYAVKVQTWKIPLTQILPPGAETQMKKYSICTQTKPWLLGPCPNTHLPGLWHGFFPPLHSLRNCLHPYCPRVPTDKCRYIKSNYSSCINPWSNNFYTVAFLWRFQAIYLL